MDSQSPFLYAQEKVLLRDEPLPDISGVHQLLSVIAWDGEERCEEGFVYRPLSLASSLMIRDADRQIVLPLVTRDA
jgi:hypothetical protein